MGADALGGSLGRERCGEWAVGRALRLVLHCIGHSFQRLFCFVFASAVRETCETKLFLDESCDEGSNFVWNMDFFFMAETFSDRDLRRFSAALRLLTRGQETNHGERTWIPERLQKDRR